ncbi:MAG TPA: sigma-54 dependent transcriptional regulator [Vicinamibacteria bacterium]|nr:sigma-54 dependent transcriptional regulator [Vicinamibacteria bacterium]
MVKHRILVVDDEEPIRKTLRMTLEYEGYDVIEASSGSEALVLTDKEPVDLVFLDVKMPGMDGLEVLGKLRERENSPQVIVVSGHGNVQTAVQATKLGAFDFIEKPLETERVLLEAKNALEKKELVDEVGRLRLRFERKYQMVGSSPALERVREAILRTAPTNATVLITGESGTGKELVARAIHANSQRSRGPFVQVNCAAIPEDLIESELFGHEKGSFTGATTKQIGKFEQAHKGTIFLDEVGDMSARTQAKVLRVLQEGEVERVGSQATIKVDVRIIAATNKDLKKVIEAGDFREDLYFRLSVIPIPTPPLRDRREDIELLIEHFVTSFAAEDNLRPKQFSREAMDRLKRHRFKGNVRELRNTVERALIMAKGDVIDVSDLPETIHHPDDSASPDLKPSTLKEFKETSERTFLVEKLRENNWNISQTAQLIGTPRSNLYKKLEQYQISQDNDG